MKCSFCFEESIDRFHECGEDALKARISELEEELAEKELWIALLRFATDEPIPYEVVPHNGAYEGQK